MSTETDAERKYREYDFPGDPKWQDYLNNLFPTPQPETIEKYKRKYYRQKVDPQLAPDVPEGSSPSSFNPNRASSPPEENKSFQTEGTSQRPSTSADEQSRTGFSSNAGSSQTTSNASGANIQPPKVGTIKEILFNLEGWLKVLFIMTAFWFGFLANWLAFTICILGMMRQCGRPRWSKQYGQKIMSNEFTQNLFYMIPFAFFPGAKTLVYFLPLGIYFWVGACEYIVMRQAKLYSIVKKYIDSSRQQSAQLKFMKAKVEVFIIIYIIIMVLIGSQSFILILFYGNFLRIKYMVNLSTQYAFANINNWIQTKIVNNPSVPGIVKLVVEKLRIVCGYLTKM